MTDTSHTIPLNKLDLGERNVRKTGADEDLGDLIASIAAHGLLQSLVVQQGKRGRFAVIAGGRRLRALQALAEAGKVPANHEVQCRVIPGDVDASELSLAENIIRAPMHPADQFEAFVAVIDQGKSVTDVAARFNVSENLVTQRLKLGRLAPSILQAYREEVIDLEEAQAFTLSDDHAEQERVFAELGNGHRSAWRIRQALTQDEVPATDKRARCVGLEAYEAAGGTVRRDLFQKNDHCYLQDVALLDRLVHEKLAATVDEVRNEGWLWVELMPDADYSALSKFERLYPKRQSIPQKDRKQIDKLKTQYDAIIEKLEEEGVCEDEIDEATQAKLDTLQERIDKLTPAPTWSGKTLSTSGAIVRLGHDGEIDVERGLMRPQQARKAKTKAKDAAAKANGTPEAAGFSAKLVEDLTSEKTAAIRTELADRPDIALACVVHALGMSLWYRGYSADSCLELKANSATLATDCKATQSLESKREAWGDRLPGEAADFFAWCLQQPRETLDELLAFFAACMVNGVQRKHLKPGSASLVHADALARALKLDMTAWFTPTAENFFGKISRKTIFTVVDEAKGAPQGPGLEKLNKADLASRAAQIVQGTGWLPSPLRVVSNDNARTDMPMAAE